MLSLIQHPTETTKINFVEISKDDRKKLRVLDALAALLIREHEKVAVIAKPTGKSIQVISVVNLNNPGSTVTASGSWCIQWLSSLNSRITPPLFPEDEEDSMRVVDPESKAPPKLLELKDDPNELLDTFLLENW